MTAILVAQRLADGEGHRILFDALDSTVAAGDIVGLFGANGAGKSTLLWLLAGIDEQRAGTIRLFPADAFVGWLPQDHGARPRRGRCGLPHASRRARCCDQGRGCLGDPSLAALGADLANAHSVALECWLVSGAADLDERLSAILANLGLDARLVHVLRHCCTPTHEDDQPEGAAERLRRDHAGARPRPVLPCHQPRARRR